MPQCDAALSNRYRPDRSSATDQACRRSIQNTFTDRRPTIHADPASRVQGRADTTTTAAPIDGSHSVTTDYDYDHLGRLDTITEQDEIGNTLASYDWDYDAVGRLTDEVIDHWDNTFDQADRLEFEWLENDTDNVVDQTTAMHTTRLNRRPKPCTMDS